MFVNDHYYCTKYLFNKKSLEKITLEHAENVHYSCTQNNLEANVTCRHLKKTKGKEHATMTSQNKVYLSACYIVMMLIYVTAPVSYMQICEAVYSK